MEEHGTGKQIFRFKIQPRFSGLAAALSVFFMLTFVWAEMDQAIIESLMLLTLAVTIAARTTVDSGFSIGAILSAIRALRGIVWLLFRKERWNLRSVKSETQPQGYRSHLVNHR